jgi:hypothetical protein
MVVTFGATAVATCNCATTVPAQNINTPHLCLFPSCIAYSFFAGIFRHYRVLWFDRAFHASLIIPRSERNRPARLLRSEPIVLAVLLKIVSQKLPKRCWCAGIVPRELLLCQHRYRHERAVGFGAKPDDTDQPTGRNGELDHAAPSRRLCVLVRQHE